MSKMSNLEYETLRIEGLIAAQDIMLASLKQQRAEYTFWRFLWDMVSGQPGRIEEKTLRIYGHLHEETNRLLKPYLTPLNMEAK